MARETNYRPLIISRHILAAPPPPPRAPHHLSTTPKIAVNGNRSLLCDLKSYSKLTLRASERVRFYYRPLRNKFHRSAIIIKKCRELVACKRRAVTRPSLPAHPRPRSVAARPRSEYIMHYAKSVTLVLALENTLSSGVRPARFPPYAHIHRAQFSATADPQ